MGIITGELDPATGVRWLNSEDPATCCQMTRVITVVTHDVLGGVRVPANMPAFVEPAEVGVAAETEATDADKVVEATYPRMPSTQIRAKLTHSDRLPPPWYMSHHDVAVLPWSPTDGVDDVLSGDVDLAYIGHASGLHSFDDKTLALVPYCRAQLYLWAEETNPPSPQKESVSQRPRRKDDSHPGKRQAKVMAALPRSVSGTHRREDSRRGALL